MTNIIKFGSIGLGVIALMTMLTAPVLADKEGMMGKYGAAGKSNTGHLYLYEKNPADWTIVKDGARGKMKYNLSGQTFDFVFNGKKLEPNVDYSLIYYPDPWPGNNLIVLGTGTANKSGNIHIQGSANTGNLPTTADQNYNGGKDPGAKIWLVKSSDITTTGTPHMTAWNPTEYLFEHNLITFNVK